MVMSDGEAALPNLMRTATGKLSRRTTDWFHLSMCIRTIEPTLLGSKARCLLDPKAVEAAQASVEQVRHLPGQGLSEQADPGLVRLLSYKLEIANRKGEPRQALRMTCGAFATG